MVDALQSGSADEGDGVNCEGRTAFGITWVIAGSRAARRTVFSRLITTQGEDESESALTDTPLPSRLIPGFPPG